MGPLDLDPIHFWAQSENRDPTTFLKNIKEFKKLIIFFSIKIFKNIF